MAEDVRGPLGQAPLCRIRSSCPVSREGRTRQQPGDKGRQDCTDAGVVPEPREEVLDSGEVDRRKEVVQIDPGNDDTVGVLPRVVHGGAAWEECRRDWMRLRLRQHGIEQPALSVERSCGISVERTFSRP